MKILRLDLLAYGPFSGESLDLSAGSEGLHIVYGPNEAGKSTALRALRALFFGMGHLTADNHVHANNDLRVGALLRLSTGETLEVIRRKGRANTLRDAADTGSIDAQVLQSALGHIDERAFDSRFGIDHEQLVAGGREIAQGEGDLGQLLFAASAGIVHLRRLQEQLEKDANDIYNSRSRGSNPPAINAALRDLAEQNKRLRTLQLAADDWEAGERELAAAKAQLADVDGELSSLGATRSRLSRYASALPIASRRRELAAELDALGGVAPLADDFAERRRAAQEQMRLAAHAERKAAEEVARIDERLAELGPPPAILDHVAEVEAVCRELDRHSKGAEDRPRICVEEEQFSSRARAIVARVSRTLEGDDELCVVLRTSDRARIQELGGRFAELSARREAADKRRAKLDRQLAEAAAELSQLPAATDDDAIKRLLRRVGRLAEVEAQHAADSARLAADERQLEIEAARLGRSQGDAAALECLGVPAAETVELLAQRRADVEKERESALQQRNAIENEKSRAEADLAALRRAASAPTEAELAVAREKRDASWRQVRDGLAAGDFPRATASAMGYEALVAAADALSDAMRRDAQTVAQRAALEYQVCRNAEAFAEADEVVRRAERAAADWLAQWNELWRTSGVVPQGPREMLAWLADRRRWCDSSAAWRTRQAENRAVASRLAEARKEVDAALASLAAAAPQATLAEAIDALEAAQERLERERQRRRDLEQAHAQWSAELRDLADEAAAADAELAAWRTAWSAAVAPLGHDGDLSPAQAQAILVDLAEVENLLDKSRSCAARIDGIDRDVADYAQRLVDVAGRAAADLGGGRPSPANVRGIEELAGKLAARLSHAREADTERRKLAADRRRHAAELAAARANAAAAAAALDALCREASAATPDELTAIEERSARQAELRRELARQDERLRDFAAGATLADFLAELGAVDSDALPGEETRVESRLAELGQTRGALCERIWKLEHDRASTSGRADAAEANAQLQSLRADLEENVARYARLKLASAVLRRAIDDYRQKNEAPLLKRASDVFSRLTCGAFAGLKTDYDGQNTVLVAVRAATGKSVGVAGLSDGTCDQLYLALRLASVEQYLDGHPPIPFIVDDVLQRFDDGRAAAALGALAELARRTQVIFFTHHRHVLQLAAEHLANEDYCEHCLGDGRPAGKRGRGSAAASAR
jgi:uncharacterized protein YhaN